MSFFSNLSNHVCFDYGPIPMDTNNTDDTDDANDNSLLVELQSISSKINTHQLRTRKTPIPKRLKTDVWDFYIGEEKGIALCMCCSREKIKASHFECGHVISEYNGGNICIENLRPICSQCNRSMSKKNMDEFMDKCGYEFPKNWIGKEQYLVKSIRKNGYAIHNKVKNSEIIIIE